MKLKILITGSTGFVGRHLVVELLNEGFEVLEITRNIQKSIRLFGMRTTKLLNDDGDFKDKINEFKPNIVIHLASYLTSSDNWTDVKKLVDTNLLFLSKVLDAVSNIDLKLFINTGTFAEYYKGDNELIPSYFYAATKTASRAIVDYYSIAYSFNQCTVIPYTIYGGNDSQKKIIDVIYDSTLSKKPLDLSPGGQVLDFIHIDDVVNFYITIIKNVKILPNKINFKLGTGIGHNLKQVASYVEEITLRKTNINWGGKPYRGTDVMYAVANLKENSIGLEWKPNITLKEGLKNYFLNRTK